LVGKDTLVGRTAAHRHTRGFFCVVSTRNATQVEEPPPPSEAPS